MRKLVLLNTHMAEKKIVKKNKKLADCGSGNCEPCQCHRFFKVVCKGHHHKAGHGPRPSDQTGQDGQKNSKKSTKTKSLYSTKYLMSLISLRTWVIAPETKPTFKTLDLRKSKLVKIPENLPCRDTLEAIRFDGSQSFHDASFFKDVKNLRVAVLKHCNLQEFSGIKIEHCGLLALDIYGNRYVEDFTDLKIFSQLQHLNIGCCNLIAIPEEIFWLRKLRVLILDDNNFNEPLADLSTLSKLQVLLIQNCGLTEIPESIFDLDELLYFSIESNKITAVPSAITRLKKLTVFSVYGNNKIQLSSKLTKCPELKRINVDHTFPSKSLSSKMSKLVKVWKDTPCAWWKQL